MHRVPLESPLYCRLAPAGQALLGAMALAAALLGGPELGLRSGIFFAASSAYLLRRNRRPDLYNVLVVVAALVNAAGWVGLFDLFRPYYDGLVHLISTALLTLALFHVLYRGRLKGAVASRPTPYALAIASLALSLGVLWELLEFAVEPLFGTRLNTGIQDVMRDLVADLLGALLAAGLGLAHRGAVARAPSE